MKNYILLENVEIYAYHGVMPQETLVGNTFIINIKITVDLREASQSDNLEDTINYARVYELVKDEMGITSKLLEHVAGRIIKRLRNEFDKIQEVEIKLAKRNPPMSGQIEYASVILKG